MVQVSAKAALVAVTLLCATLFSGALFGWATLQLIFEDDGVFSQGCEHVPRDEICEKQRNKFSLVYNVTSSFLAFGSFFWGLFVDKLGPVWASSASGLCITGGLLLFGVSEKDNLPGFIFGGMLLAVGGGLTLLNSFTLSYVLDQEHMPLVLSAVNCLFDASAITFLFVYLLYTHLHVGRASLFIGMAVLSVVLYALLTALWYGIESELKLKKAAVFEVTQQDIELPETATSDEMEGVEMGEENKLVKEEEESEEISDRENNIRGSSTIPPNLATASPLTQDVKSMKRQSSRTVLEKHSTHWLKEMQSRAFLFSVIFGSLQFFRVNVMFGTILDILKGLGDEDTGFLYTQIFVATLPLGFLAIPAITYCLKRFGLVYTYHIITLLSCGYGGCLMIPVLEVQVVTFLFFTFFRAYLFSVMSYFSVHRFGPINSGKIYGLTMSVAGAFNFLNYPMVLVVNQQWNGDYFYYNLIQFLFFVPLVLAVHFLLKPIVEKLDDICIRTSAVTAKKANDEEKETDIVNELEEVE